MEMKINCAKKSMNNKGFTYLESIVSLFIFVNIFVLLTQIFYNINTYETIKPNNRVLEFETAILRIETDLKTADSINIETNYLEYKLNNQLIRYYVFNNKFTMQIDYKTNIYYLYDIREVYFQTNNNLIYIKFIDLENNEYESKIINPQK